MTEILIILAIIACLICIDIASTRLIAKYTQYRQQERLYKISNGLTDKQLNHLKDHQEFIPHIPRVPISEDIRENLLKSLRDIQRIGLHVYFNPPKHPLPNDPGMICYMLYKHYNISMDTNEWLTQNVFGSTFPVDSSTRKYHFGDSSVLYPCWYGREGRNRLYVLRRTIETLEAL